MKTNVSVDIDIRVGERDGIVQKNSRMHAVRVSNSIDVAVFVMVLENAVSKMALWKCRSGANRINWKSIQFWTIVVVSVPFQSQYCDSS